MKLSRRAFISGVVGSSAVALLSPWSSPSAQAEVPGSDGGSSRIRFVGTGFDPMVAHVRVGSHIPFRNHGSLPLDLVAAPGSPTNVRLQLAAGAQGSLAFPKPGIFLLYDNATTRFDDQVGQVVARKASDAFPRPAYAVVVVTDQGGRGLQAGDGRIDIPEETMTFQPWSIVVKSGQTVQFRNEDGDAHVAMPSPEPMLMPTTGTGDDSGATRSRPWLQAMNAFAPVNLPANGGTGEVRMSQPGVHHYYCPVHAAYDSEADTFAPLQSYGGFPFVMDGIIVVLPD